MSEWMSRLIAKYAEVNESKFLIPEEIPANERTAFHGAAAAASKAGKSHFNFNGKKHPVTMKKDTAKAIADDVKEAKYTECDCEEVELDEDRRTELHHQSMMFTHAMKQAELKKKDPRLAKQHDMAGKLHAKAADMHVDNHPDAKKHSDKANKASKLLGEEAQLDEISRTMTPMRNRFGGNVDPKKFDMYKKHMKTHKLDEPTVRMIHQNPNDAESKRMMKNPKYAQAVSLYKASMKKESVEKIAEISQDKLRQYHGKAAADLQRKRDKVAKGKLSMLDLKKGQNRVKGLNRAANKMEEVEIEEAKVDEISMSKLGRYSKAAAKDIEQKRNKVKAALDQPASVKHAKAGLKAMQGLTKRSKGSDMYVNKLTGRSKVKPTAEAYENIPKATHKGPSSPPGEGLSPSAKDQLAKKMPTPEPIDEPKVDAKNFKTFRKGLKQAKKRPGDK